MHPVAVFLPLSEEIALELPVFVVRNFQLGRKCHGICDSIPMVPLCYS
jgi:hypothetical protein